MSKTLNQIYTDNPASSMQNTDLLYLSRSPYSTGTDYGITYSNFQNSIGAVKLSPAANQTITNFGLTLPSIHFSDSSKGILGITDGSNASPGYVGEIISRTIPLVSSVNVISSGVPTDLTSISLTAGDWDIFGNMYFTANVINSPVQAHVCWLNISPASPPDFSQISANGSVPNTATTTGDGGMCTPILRINTTSPINIYLTGLSVYDGIIVTEVSMCGSILARRAR